MISSSTMQINPDIEDCFTLRGWYDTSGSNETFKSHSGSSSATSGFGFNRSELKGLDEVKQAAYGMPGNPEYFSARGIIMHIKSEPLSYPARSNEGCSKKVEEVGKARRCEKCDQSFNELKHWYIFFVRDLGNTNQASDEPKFTAIVKKSCGCTYNFSCHAKQDTWKVRKAFCL